MIGAQSLVKLTLGELSQNQNQNHGVDEHSRAQLNFSGPWENISTLWQYLLLLQFYKTLPNLTLSNQFSIPFPSPTGDHLNTAPNPVVLNQGAVEPLGATESSKGATDL